jgi:hypothetical protein
MRWWDEEGMGMSRLLVWGFTSGGVRDGRVIADVGGKGRGAGGLRCEWAGDTPRG